jgi:gas vesicle protein
LAAGLVAFAGGWLVASLLPATKQEEQLAETIQDKAADLKEPLKEQAQQVAQELKDNLQEPAQQAVQQVKETATDAATTVKDEGQYQAASVSEEAKSSAQNVGSEQRRTRIRRHQPPGHSRRGLVAGHQARMGGGEARPGPPAGRRRSFLQLLVAVPGDDRRRAGLGVDRRPRPDP